MSADLDTLMRAEIRGLRKRLEECERALVGSLFGESNDPGLGYVDKYGLDVEGNSAPTTSMLNEWTLGGES